MKIRPAEFRDLDDDVWEGVQIIREVLRERGDISKSMSERVRDLLGMETEGMDIQEVVDDAFEGLSVPEDVQTHVDAAVAYVERDDLPSAKEELRDAFGSVCETDVPENHVVDDAGRISHCHRHLEEYDEPATFLETHGYNR